MHTLVPVHSSHCGVCTLCAAGDDFIGDVKLSLTASGTFKLTAKRQMSRIRAECVLSCGMAEVGTVEAEVSRHGPHRARTPTASCALSAHCSVCTAGGLSRP